ncbi:hypothetical protein ASZ78_015803 [Callipepla squamata]|uniref:Protein kinase domain-containing protein n=1 Tax=Callipepla squamata TaxID=9009 RepID=A0A226NIC9_CALSU|nr:hypothetical protein ASZ78_015803 [Callipepla squamata]
MQSTPNYLWSTDDLLGQGATACVYKARSKKSGELVAVKVFNKASYLRPHEVQMREFEMLRKLNHKNIVKLFAVEETGSSKQKVLVMEYCSSGSLLSVLEDPINAFGLAEPEFLVVLQCVVAGMNHLRENGVVHRDIKPGNIMRLVGEDGQSIYKLTDFGAARELEDDEKFVSVYGTEEYLHPDMYERAVLRKPQQKAYGVTVDLWSIGVTFYHAATGSLPFLPFGGPRRNKETMYKITTEKPPGAIAGVQRQENGGIEWSYELPLTCQLSAGLKDQLVPILANILEVDQEKCWGFDQFFAETNDILHRIAVDVFSLQQASSHRIYIHSYNTTSKFLDAVFKQTDVVPHHQEYFFEGHPYELDPNLQAHNFCRTARHSPLILLSCAEQPEDVVGVRYRDPALDFPKFVPKVDVVADCRAAKSAVGAVHQALRIAQELRRCQELEVRGMHWVIGNLRSECLRVLEQRRGVHAVLSGLQLMEGKTRGLVWIGLISAGSGSTQPCQLREVAASHLAQRQLTTTRFGNKLHTQLGRGDGLFSLLGIQDGFLLPSCSYEAVPGGSTLPALKDVAAVKMRLQRVVEELSQCSHSIFDFQGALDGIVSELVQHGQQAHEDKSIQQIECCLEKMQLIYKQFRKARTCPGLGYNEEQIHKLDKVNLGHLARKVLLIFQEECAQKYQEALALHSSRTRKVCEIKKHLKRISNCISGCSVEAGECQDCLQLVGTAGGCAGYRAGRVLALYSEFLALCSGGTGQISAGSCAREGPGSHSAFACSPEPSTPGDGSAVSAGDSLSMGAAQMQELLEQMKSVTCNLQSNNGIIER